MTYVYLAPLRTQSTNVNSKQKSIMAEFMKNHSDLAKGMLVNNAQGRAVANRLWNDLATKLNSAGPPIKDIKAWRKVLIFYEYFHYYF